MTIYHKRLSTTTLAFLAMLSCLTFSQYCSAQVRRYQPNSPTVSPYLNLTRFNNGNGLPNYYSLVRPQQQQRAFNLRERALRQQQAGLLGRVQNDLQRASEVAGTGTGSWFLVPGSRSNFLDTTQYYPQTTLGRRR